MFIGSVYVSRKAVIFTPDNGKTYSIYRPFKKPARVSPMDAQAMPVISGEMGLTVRGLRSLFSKIYMRGRK